MTCDFTAFQHLPDLSSYSLCTTMYCSIMPVQLLWGGYSDLKPEDQHFYSVILELKYPGTLVSDARDFL